ncbi:MAG: hypothetical protein K6T83_02115 [Alicyclobacillus sp.]|nr:hypothetical protein [Alicyclobacillus sp.]
MEIRAGIVGPRDSVSLICEIVENDREMHIHPVPLVYKHLQETKNIVQTHLDLVDIWLFSGLHPYSLAKQSFPNHDTFFFFPGLDGSSLMKVFVEIGCKDHRDLLRLSIDMLREKDVLDAYRDLGLPFKDVYVFERAGETPHEEYMNFHLSLMREGRVDTCVTGLRSVYEELQAMNVPVYRITPTRTNIKNMVKTAVQQWETFHFKQSQIAVILVQTGNIEHLNDSRSRAYDLHRMNLQLETAVVDFAESITGTFVPVGIGKFMVFTTRGCLEQEGSRGLSLLQKLSMITDIPSNIGIGYGESSLAAEENARLALQYSQTYHEFCAFLVDSDGTVEGPLNSSVQISYQYRTQDSEINDLLRLAGVSVTTYNRILAVQKHLGNHSVTAADVADWLKMTHRNARRILTSLVDQGLAEIVGEEAPPRGRPRKIYRVGATLFEEMPT